MAKGVKKVRYISGKVDEKNSKPTQIIALPNETITFGVREWEDGTTEADKKNGITWIWQTANRIKVLGKVHASFGQNFIFTIPPSLCGAYAYYIEASLTGKTDVRKTGVTVMGHCPPKIKNAHWANAQKGTAITEANSFGGTLFIDLRTEGLNGYNSLAIEIYNKNGDKYITTISTGRVTNGDATAEVKTTFWQMHMQQNIEAFYIKVKNPNNGKHIPDANKNEIHAPINIKNSFVFVMPTVPTNKSPFTVGNSKMNISRIDPCQYTELELINHKGKSTILYKEGEPKYNFPKVENGVIVGGIKNKQKFTIKVDDNSTMAQCHRKSRHTKQLKFSSQLPTNVTIIKDVGKQLEFEAWFDYKFFDDTLIALKYIWPTSDLLGAKINTLHLVAETCRVNKNINIKIYPDIKWELGFVFSLKNPLGYTFGAKATKSKKSQEQKDLIAERIYKEAHKKAFDSGTDRSKLRQDKNLDTEFFLSLKGKFDKVEGAYPTIYNHEKEYGHKWAKKISDFLDILMKLKKMAKKAQDEAGGIGKKLGDSPFAFEIMSPKIGAFIEWKAEKVLNGDNKGKICNAGVLKLVADPLVGAEFTINMLEAASKMNPIVFAVKKGVDFALGKFGGFFKIDAVFYGNLKVTIESLKINSLGNLGLSEKPAKIDGKMGIRIVLQLKIEGKYKMPIFNYQLDFVADAKATGEAYFGGTVLCESDEKGVYWDAKGQFSGLLFSIEIEFKANRYKIKPFKISKQPMFSSDTIELGKQYLT